MFVNKYKFRFSPLVGVLLCLVLIVCIAGCAWNAFNLTQYLWAGAIKIASYSLLVLITAFLALADLLCILNSYYSIANGRLKVSFGIFRTSIKVSDITSVIHFKKSDKLVVYFQKNGYSVIMISPSQYESFILSLREANPLVVYDVRIDGEDTPR